MSARLVFILMLLAIGFVFYGGAYVGYLCYKKNTEEWKADGDRIKRMSWPVLILSGGGSLLISSASLIKYFIIGGIDFILVVGVMLWILVIAIYVVTKRGGTVAMLMFAAITVLYLFFAGILIGLPEKAPIFTLDDRKIVLSHTTASDLMEDGFGIYIEQTYEPGLDYEDILSLDSFKKYPADGSVHVEKGFKINDAPYPLVKDNVVIGYIGLYGSENKETVLEDCKIVSIVLTEESVKVLRENSFSCKLNGLELMAPIKPEEVKKTFGRKLWHVPVNPTDITELKYGIDWSNPWTPVNHLFWDEYFAWISFDENNNLTKLELSALVAQDRS